MFASTFWNATFTSLWIGALSSLTTLVIALGLCLGGVSMSSKWARATVMLPAYFYLLVPSVVLSLGLFIIVRNAGVFPGTAAPFVLILGNTLLAMPFAISTINPALSAIQLRHNKVMTSLGMSSARRFVAIEWPLIRNEVGTVAALSFCFSLGDLGIISLFGTQDFATLPWAINRALGSYRTNDADAMTAVLITLTFTAFILIPLLFSERKKDA